MSPRAERKVHVLLELAGDWGAAGFGRAAAVAGNRPDAMGARANATETPAATVLRIARIPLRKVLRVNLRMLKIGRSIDTLLVINSGCLCITGNCGVGYRECKSI